MLRSVIKTVDAAARDVVGSVALIFILLCCVVSPKAGAH
jgi:hypothetical protein